MNFSTLLDNICCDSRVVDGVPDLNNLDFCFILQEYLLKGGYSIDEVTERTAILFEKGNFPERQAYNTNGILVTFPSKEYRDKAVDKGTHFSENPKAVNPTIFTNSDPESLTTADIKVDEPEDTDDPQDSDTFTLDDYVEDKVDDYNVDTRSGDEKEVDADAIRAMLLDDPLPTDTFEIDEFLSKTRKNLKTDEKLYSNGSKWYVKKVDYVEAYDNDKCDGIVGIDEDTLIGEEYFSEKRGKSLIKLCK